MTTRTRRPRLHIAKIAGAAFRQRSTTLSLALCLAAGLTSACGPSEDDGQLTPGTDTGVDINTNDVTEDILNTVCGDGLAEGAEACDGADLRGQDCVTEGFDEGTLTCTDLCRLDFSPCSDRQPVCGDDAINNDEECDGTALGGQTCGDLGFAFGALGCSEICTFDSSTCSDDPVCGDGSTEGTEECDDGNVVDGDGCAADCITEFCGDGFVQPDIGEACDTGSELIFNCDEVPGRPVGYQACVDCSLQDRVCADPARCGDGILDLGEACDDSNTNGGDGCNSQCQSESCGDGSANGEACDGDDFGDLTCLTFGFGGGELACDACTVDIGSCGNPSCGNGEVEGTEACDDGGRMSGDGCDRFCQVEVCGDGVLTADEGCDDGNDVDTDGCTSCSVDRGFACEGAPSTCATNCGDGIRAGDETCDDGDRNDGDGCGATCATEEGWTCSGTPSLCGTTCGDGRILGNEECDDANVGNGDGCSASCRVEDGWECPDAGLDCAGVCGDGQIVGVDDCDLQFDIVYEELGTRAFDDIALSTHIYTFDGTALDSVYFGVNGEGSRSMSVELFGPSGNAVTAASSTASPAEFSVTLQQSGTYRVVVRDATIGQGIGRYSWHLYGTSASLSSGRPWMRHSSGAVIDLPTTVAWVLDANEALGATITHDSGDLARHTMQIPTPLGVRNLIDDQGNRTSGDTGPLAEQQIGLTAAFDEPTLLILRTQTFEAFAPSVLIDISRAIRSDRILVDATGDCAGAHTGMLRVAARAIAPNGVIELCEGPQTAIAPARIVTSGVTLQGDPARPQLTSLFGPSVIVAAADSTIATIDFEIPPVAGAGASTGIFIESTTRGLVVDDCGFRTVTSPQAGGSGITSDTTPAQNITIRDSRFSMGANLAGDYAGVSIFADDVLIEDCVAGPEMAGEQAGGFRIYGDGAEVLGSHCGNAAMNSLVSNYCVSIIGDQASVLGLTDETARTSIYIQGTGAPGETADILSYEYLGTTGNPSEPLLHVINIEDVYIANAAVLGFPDSESAIRLDNSGGQVENSRLSVQRFAGIQVIPSATQPPLVLVNNTISRSDGYPGAAGIEMLGGFSNANVSVYNNLVHGPASPVTGTTCGLRADADIVASNNLYSDVDSAYCGGVTAASGDVVTIAAPEGSELRISAGHPADGAGLQSVAPLSDFEGDSRAGSADIGADQLN